MQFAALVRLQLVSIASERCLHNAEQHVLCLRCRARRPSLSNMPAGRTPTGRIVDWKPPTKETPAKPSVTDTPTQSGSKEAKRPDQAPASGTTSLDANHESSRCIMMCQCCGIMICRCRRIVILLSCQSPLPG